jgi:AcrR family transcriptional regulator
MTQPPYPTEPADRTDERTPPVRRRPKDRRERLIARAAELFGEHGYHNVSMEQIGAAVGMSGSAVYRHFSTKEELFAATVERAVDRTLSAITATADDGDVPMAVLERIAEAITAASGAESKLFLVYLHEAAYLAGERRQRIHDGQERVMRLFTDRLLAARPGLTADQAEFLIRAATGVIFGWLRAGARGPSRRLRTLVERIFLAVLLASPPAMPEEPGMRMSGDEPTGAFAAGSSRREELLAAAARLFRRSGFREVGMVDIGAEAGISGPAVYRYFRSKQALLVAAFRRTHESIAAGTAQALAVAANAPEALDGLVHSYLAAALANRDLIVVYQREAHSLPEADRREFAAIQNEYFKQWAHVLGMISPHLSEAEAQLVGHAVIGLSNELIGSDTQMPDAALRDWLASTVRHVIDSLNE